MAALFDFHIHSHLSFDSFQRPEKILRQAQRRGLRGLAITDHNRFGLDLASLSEGFPDLLLIPGMEIGTEIGDVLVLFLKEEIRTRNFREVAEKAKEQEALLVLAHPFKRGCGPYGEEIMKEIHAVEVRNGQNRANWEEAGELARKWGKPALAGSDAHFLSQIGSTYTLLPEVGSLAEVKEAILRGETEVAGEGLPAWWALPSRLTGIIKRIFGKKRRNVPA